jgi:hypothetical protein
MTALSYTDRQKLAAILSRLGSSFDGEVTAAGLAAARFVRDRGLSWNDLILGAPNDIKPAPANSDVVIRWREQIAACLAQPGGLRKWEVDFLRSLQGFRKISPKQRNGLIQIADRVLRRAA